ncbi:MAG: PhnE/PtxC family ABC transporter permease [Planctomycetota bacterium]|jgi:phosphonate transport system permease protein
MAPRRQWPVGARVAVFVAILAAGLWAAAALGLFSGAGVGEAGLAAAGKFFSRALSPSLVSEAPPPFGGASILPSVLRGAWNTLVFAAAALGLAFALGMVLGFLGSTAWWAGEAARTGTLSRTLLAGTYGAVRVFIAVLRSVHELIWAVIFLAALGRSDLAAVAAIAIPFSGTMAKLVSEVIDETPRGPALALRAAGASPVQVFAFGLLPRALPDIAANLFYQFECALRSSTILGFFGYPTLGYFIGASFENLYYGEVWTYLYALFGLVLLTEWWSGALRRRLA